jgi:hypothetical protein
MNQSVVRYIEMAGRTPFLMREIIHPSVFSGRSYILSRFWKQLVNSFRYQVVFLCIIICINFGKLKQNFVPEAKSILKRYLRAVAWVTTAGTLFWLNIALMRKLGGPSFQLDSKFKIVVNLLISIFAVNIEDASKLHILFGLITPIVLRTIRRLVKKYVPGGSILGLTEIAPVMPMVAAAAVGFVAVREQKLAQKETKEEVPVKTDGIMNVWWSEIELP